MSGMFNQPGPFEVVCNIPPHPIVVACEAIGIKSPQDVRWEKMTPEMEREQEEQKRGIMDLLFGTNVLTHIPKPLCICKKELPKISLYRFTYASGDEQTFGVGQCQHCRTVWWKEAINAVAG